MQLNIYVPKEKAKILDALDEASRRTGRPKNELVLAALAAFLTREPAHLGVFHLGDIEFPSREELYLDRDDGAEQEADSPGVGR